MKRRRRSWSVSSSKDPTTYTLLFEDTAALSGLLIASIGVFCFLDMPYFGEGASICVGFVLAAVAVLLVYETRSLLVGEAVDPETLKDIRSIAESDSQVESVTKALTMYFGPHTILLAMDLRFHPNFQLLKSNRASTGWNRIRSRYPDIKHILSSPNLFHQNIGEIIVCLILKSLLLPEHLQAWAAQPPARSALAGRGSA